MSDNLSLEEIEETVYVLIRYFNTFDRLNETDFRGNNAFHWAAKLNSFEAWKTFRDILDKDSVALNVRNVSGIGDTPWELVLQSTDLDFIKEVLLDELDRNPDSNLINDLIEHCGSDIQRFFYYKSKNDFILKYVEYRNFLAGNLTEEITDNAYQRWKTKQESDASNVDVFFKDGGYQNLVESTALSISQNFINMGSSTLWSTVQSGIRDCNYTCENELVQELIVQMRIKYQEWKDNKIEENKNKYQFQNFTRTPEFLWLLNIALKNNDEKGLQILNKKFSIKEILEDPQGDRKGQLECILSLYTRSYFKYSLEILGYKDNEIKKMEEKILMGKNILKNPDFVKKWYADYANTEDKYKKSYAEDVLYIAVKQFNIYNIKNVEMKKDLDLKKEDLVKLTIYNHILSNSKVIDDKITEEYFSLENTSTITENINESHPVYLLQLIKNEVNLEAWAFPFDVYQKVCTFCMDKNTEVELVEKVVAKIKDSKARASVYMQLADYYSSIEDEYSSKKWLEKIETLHNEN